MSALFARARLPHLFPPLLYRETRPLVLTLILLFNCLLQNPADAARVSTGPRDIGCDWTLSGPIALGDANLFLSKIFIRNERPGWGTLCLDSHGGQLSEAFLIMERVQQMRLNTSIPSGARCFSACAFIFMAGLRQTDRGVEAQRKLHVAGTLGFHSPYIIPADRPYSKQELSETFAFAVANITRLIDLSARHDDSDAEETSLVPRYVLINALRTSPNQLFYIDTIEKALRAGVSIQGSRQPPFDVSGARNRCENRWLLRNSRKGPISRGDPTTPQPLQIIKAPPPDRPLPADQWFGVIYPFEAAYDSGGYLFACLVLPNGVRFEPAYDIQDLPELAKSFWKHEPEFLLHEEPWWSFARTTALAAIAEK
jgi:hypothetical protein